MTRVLIAGLIALIVSILVGPRFIEFLRANEFGQQEPGSDTQIKEFCEATYHVEFPMFSKIVVKGEGINPLYKWLIANSGSDEDIHWNFEKFLVGRDGKVVKRFSPRTLPDSPEVVSAVEAALGK